MTQLSAIKSRFYELAENTRGFSHERFKDDWNQSNNVKLSDLEFLVANFLEEIDKLLDEKESTKAIEWF